jgi:hypothetical protein
MFDLIKNLFKKSEPVVENKITEKEMATAKKEPYVRVVDTQFDPKNPANGYFELDWNSVFIDELRKAGYNGDTEEEIVDKWFKAICQNVVSESNPNQEVRIV